MSSIEVVLALLLLATVLAGLARRARVPEPILLVIAGIAVGLLPGLPHIELEPQLVFLLFLPPILYSAGYFTSIRDFKANLRPILLLSIGLVLFTTVAVAAVLRAFVPELPWAAAFAFGAIVSPPDAVAATAVFRRLRVPRRLVTILEGESLVNDATALVLLRTSLVALAGTFSVVAASADFVVVVAGGIVVGLVAGRIAGWFTTRIQDPDLGIVLSLLVPALAYLPAEALHVSGVLAVVIAGIYAGRIAARSLNSAQRVEGVAAWNVVLFLVNGLVFTLIGLQLPVILADLDGSAWALLALAAAMGVTVIVARFAWVFASVFVSGVLPPRFRVLDPVPSWQRVAIISWAGMRGVVSLAAALALPVDFPQRSLLQFLTFAVILATLVLQGLTLPVLIRALGVSAGDNGAEEERQARLLAAQAAVARIDRLEAEYPGHRELIDHLRETYAHRVEHIEPTEGQTVDEAIEELLEHRRIRRAVIDAEREAVIRMRDRGELSDEVMRRLERDLDLEELREDA
ncbi:MAG TPA: Na+/H+ antiporter [Candidatus Limnocylindrales bacterium]